MYDFVVEIGKFEISMKDILLVCGVGVILCVGDGVDFFEYCEFGFGYFDGYLCEVDFVVSFFYFCYGF